MKMPKLLLSLLLALSLAIIPSLTFAKEKSDPAIPQEKEMVDQKEFRKNETKRFRAEMGLPISDAIILSLTSSEENYSKKFGIYMTKEEEKQLDDRINKLDQALPKIKEYLKNNMSQDGVAGIYIDQQTGGVVHIGFKKQLNLVDSEKLNALTQFYTNTQFYQAKFTEDELNQLIYKIHENEPLLREKGINIISTSLNIIDQVVEIGLKVVDQQSIDSIEELIGYNKEMVTYKVDTPPQPAVSSRDYYRPIRAGMYIFRSGGGSCSTGWAMNYGSDYYVLTAGHCIGYIGQAWSQGGYSYNSSNLFAYSNKYQNGGNVDAAALKVDPSVVSSGVLGYNTIDFVKLKYAEWYTTDDVVGDTACIAAGNSDTTSCGTITTRNFNTTDSTGVYRSNFRQATYTSQGGDSGSLIWAGYTIMGLHSLTNSVTGASSYSHSSYIIGYVDGSPILDW